MRTRIIASAALAALLAVGLAPAGAQEAEPDCENAMAQSELNFCAYKEFEAADAELNRVYARVRAAMRETDEELEPGMRGAEAALKAGQRGWVAYRDGHCEAAGFEARGGSMEPMLVSGCMAELTRHRTAELLDLIGESEQ